MKKTSLILAILILISFQISPAQNLSLGLVGDYSFNGNANDNSGNGNNGIVNAATLSAGKNGQPNTAYRFDGSTSFIEVPNSSSLNITNGITLYALFKAEGFYTGSCQNNSLITKWNTTGVGSGYALQFTDNIYDNNCSAIDTSHNIANGVTGANNIAGQGILNYGFYIHTGQWYSLVFTQLADTQKIYIDGVLYASAKVNSSMFASTITPLWFGKNSNGLPVFKGIIDEAKIYNRALTAAEVTLLNNTTAQNNKWLKFPLGSSGNGISIGDLDIPGDSITIEALITPQSSISLYYDIVTKHTNNTNCNYYLRTSDFAITTTAGFISLVNPKAICLDSTYHVAGTYDGDSIKYFVNGVQVASKHWTGDLVQNNFKTTIGNLYPGSGSTTFEQFIGYMKEVRIWNSSRTVSQIQSNMFSLSNPTTTAGLKAYYKLGVSNTNLQGDPAWNGLYVGSQLVQVNNLSFNGSVSNINCVPCNTAITAYGPTTFCDGTDVLLAVDPGITGTYQWVKNGSIISGATNRTYVANVTAIFTCRIVTACGTIGSNAISLTRLDNATNIVTSVGATSFCAGDSISLISNISPSGYTYQWYRNNVSVRGATTATFIAKNPGIYKLVTRNSSTGCSRISSNAVTVTVNCRMADPRLRTEILELEEKAENILVYPNPNAGIFTIELANEKFTEGNALIEVTDVMGKTVYQHQVELNSGNLREEINLSENFIKGIYMIKVSSDDEIITSKVLLQ